MDAIKLATPEQIEAIKDKSDLTPRSRVLAMGDDVAVVKDTTELDPVFYGPESSHKRKLLFIWGIENMLRTMGYSEYYFNVPTRDESYIHVVKSLGAETVSAEPEFRFKKAL